LSKPLRARPRRKQKNPPSQRIVGICQLGIAPGLAGGLVYYGKTWAHCNDARPTISEGHASWLENSAEMCESRRDKPGHDEKKKQLALEEQILADPLQGPALNLRPAALIGQRGAAHSSAPGRHRGCGSTRAGAPMISAFSPGKLLALGDDGAGADPRLLRADLRAVS